MNTQSISEEKREARPAPTALTVMTAAGQRERKDRVGVGRGLGLEQRRTGRGLAGREWLDAQDVAMTGHGGER